MKPDNIFQTIRSATARVQSTALASADAGLKNIILFFVVCLVGFLGVTYTTHAATGLQIQPVKVSYTLSPGQSVSGTILLTNQSDQAVSVEPSVQDFTPVAGSDTFQFVSRAAGVTSVEDWVTIPTKSFIFQKGESKEIPFTITVPADAEPGSHFGVAFFKAINVSELQAQLKIGTQIGMLILITVPGNHLQSGNIQSFTAPTFLQHGPVPFAMQFANTGTVFYEPKGEIVIKNMFGQQVASVPIDGEVVLPTGVKRIPIVWNVSRFLLGYYRATANIRDTDGNILSSKTTGFFVIPVWYAVGALILLIIIYFLIRFIRKRVKISISLS